MSIYPPEIVKNYVLANITGLHGPVQAFNIDKLVKDTDTNTTTIEGTFKIPFDKSYNFTMTIDTNGNVLSYERKERKRMASEFDRISVS